MSATFDTLRLARTLRDKARFGPEQAEGMADAIAEAMQSDLATRALSPLANSLRLEKTSSFIGMESQSDSI